MNKVILCGNLTKDMDVKIIKGKTKKSDDTIVGRFTLAVNEGYGDNKKTTFIPITIFNKTVENLEEYLIKGTKVNVVGKLDIKNEETEEGYKTYVSVISNEIQLLKVADQEESKGYKKVVENNVHWKNRKIREWNTRDQEIH